ncbi:hypothetical protein D3C84_1236940 [compost metagenome]
MEALEHQGRTTASFHLFDPQKHVEGVAQSVGPGSILFGLGGHPMHLQQGIHLRARQRIKAQRPGQTGL